MANKIWDVVPAKDKWAKNYAKMEYDRIVWHDLWEACTYIPVECAEAPQTVFVSKTSPKWHNQQMIIRYGRDWRKTND